MSAPRYRTPLMIALCLFVAFVFVQSLFFKFSDSPETQYIFGTLDAWGASLGFPGWFSPSGVFSQYVVGSVELVASLTLLIGLAMRRQVVVGAGALLGLGVISGAIFFHLATPLGIEVRNTDGTLDGGELFALACGVWVSCAALFWFTRGALMGLLRADPAPRGL
jgi:uncharacterized membrane protein YphA (DoxX/SURF4 family)